MSEGRVDAEAITAVCSSGHKLINCGDGNWRCEGCMYELRLLADNTPPPDKGH